MLFFLAKIYSELGFNKYIIYNVIFEANKMKTLKQLIENLNESPKQEQVYAGSFAGSSAYISFKIAEFLKEKFDKKDFFYNVKWLFDHLTLNNFFGPKYETIKSLKGLEGIAGGDYWIVLDKGYSGKTRLIDDLEEMLRFFDKDERDSVQGLLRGSGKDFIKSETDKADEIYAQIKDLIKYFKSKEVPLNLDDYSSRVAKNIETMKPENGFESAKDLKSFIDSVISQLNDPRFKKWCDHLDEFYDAEGDAESYRKDLIKRVNSFIKYSAQNSDGSPRDDLFRG